MKNIIDNVISIKRIASKVLDEESTKRSLYAKHV